MGLARWVAVLSGFLILTGCGGGDDASKTITVLVTSSGGAKGPISGPFHHWRDEWEQMTGARLEIAEFPFGQLHEKIFLDLYTGTGNYDIFIICASEMGELVAGDFVVPIDQFYDDPKFPKWPKDAPPSIEMQHKWEGRWYGVLNDSDGHVLYYRKDIFANSEYQARFKDKYGYELPAPPRTMDQMLDAAEFFNGWDWNGNGKPDSGISLPLKVGAQGMFHFLSLSAPMTVLPGEKVDNVHNTYWFDFETMKPLLNEPGHVRALEYQIKLAKNGPRDQTGWDLGEAWGYFLQGHAAMIYSWGDVGALAQDPDKSKIKGKMGAAVMPGSMEIYHRGQGKFIKLDQPNVVGNTIGCSWHGVISSFSKNPDLAYHLLAFHATQRISQWNAKLGWTGVDIGRKNQLLVPRGPLSVEDYVNEGGWDASDVVQYVNAYVENFEAETFFPYLRIPGAMDYLQALDLHLSEALSGQRSAQEALDLTVKDCEQITDDRGREKQLELYRQAMNYQP